MGIEGDLNDHYPMVNFSHLEKIHNNSTLQNFYHPLKNTRKNIATRVSLSSTPHVRLSQNQQLSKIETLVNKASSA